MVTSYLLSASVAIGTPVGNVLPDEDALRYATKAIYRELEWDDIMRQYEKRYINLDEYPELAYIGVVVRVATEKRITWQWRF